MPLPASDDEVFWWSKALAGGTGGMLLLWKIVRMVRADNRTDKGADAYQDSYTKIVAGQQTEIARLHVALDELVGQLKQEGELRRKVETDCAELRHRTDRAELAAEKQHRRAAAAQEVVDRFRAQLLQAQDENEKLRSGNLPGDM